MSAQRRPRDLLARCFGWLGLALAAIGDVSGGGGEVPGRGAIGLDR